MEIHYNALLEICGATIKSALEDFKFCYGREDELEKERDLLMSKKNVKRSKITQKELYRYNFLTEKLQNYITAKHFLFSERLDLFCEGTGTDLNADYLRNIATNKKSLSMITAIKKEKTLEGNCYYEQQNKEITSRIDEEARKAEEACVGSGLEF